MTYSVGGLIQATDYNGFANDTVGANVNSIWGAGTGDAGYGQSTTLSTVSAGGVVTATQWASLVNRISSMASHQGTTITSRTAPVAGNTIQVLAAVNADLTAITNARGNAAANGTQYGTFTGAVSKTTATGSGTTPWTITFTHTITFASAAAARYFFNAGGRIKWETSKTSTGTVADAEWNDLANTLAGDIFITGGTGTQTIAGTAYTGTTKVGGTGTPTTLLTTTGWYDLTTTDTTIYKQFADTAPYTGQFIQINAKTAGTGTQLVLTTTWVDPGGSPVGSTDQISGGTAVSSPATSIGAATAPTTLVTYFPPSSTYLTEATWGTPTIAATAA
ncbi:hypothetical protein UFOVP328_221 [uncultured Caudovirales phage]|uniref:Uncharacterized protein n=1 Tax=uncultured Caudovirales phage TaxID=2100421 RepID=A0A6J5LUD3_9CAUD|nr:hypothetical protein UFOVP328_221 [uncultured Caudovirales phage]